MVLALFGEWIKKDGEDDGAGYLACATVIAAFGLAAWTTARLYGTRGPVRRSSASRSPTSASSGSRSAASASP